MVLDTAIEFLAQTAFAGTLGANFQEDVTGQPNHLPGGLIFGPGSGAKLSHQGERFSGVAHFVNQSAYR